MSSKLFRNAAAEFVYVRTYSRWIEELGRREAWPETVDRYMAFIKAERGDLIPEKVIRKIRAAILSFNVMPSMRALWAAGPAASKDNTVLYNCSYLDIDSIDAFAECLFILMCGAGVGFGVSKSIVDKLPVVPPLTSDGDGVFVVEDSRDGWAESLRALMISLYRGKDLEMDYSRVRPKGARLKTMGGRASGPAPLITLHNFVRDIFAKAQGRKLKPIECHDIANKIAEIVVVGGVRRSSQISLSDLDDADMRDAKTGNFPVHRYMANNSAVYKTKPSAVEFLREWSALAASGTGERGIFNLSAIRHCAPKRRSVDEIVGTNPCLTQETLVYVADGRGEISIGELAKEGKDVPVFCLNDRGDVCVRTMRNPRLTGHSLPVYKVTLDDGSSFKATSNHKIMLINGEYREVKDLVHGDSLKLLTTYIANINKNKNGYRFVVSSGKFSGKMEHRYIAEHHYNIKLSKDQVIHHRDFNSLNNNPSNLEVMAKADHDRLHSDLISGDNNPMRRAKTQWSQEDWDTYKTNMSNSVKEDLNPRYSGVTNDELKAHAINLTKQLGRKFSSVEWLEYSKANNLPSSFSKWRKNHLGNAASLAKYAAYECGLDSSIINVHTKTARTYQNALNSGYNAFICNNKVLINKNCEVCDKDMVVSFNRREICICSVKCSNTRLSKSQKLIKNSILLDAHKTRKNIVKIKQIEVFNELKLNTNKTPSKQEWAEECVKRGISSEIARKTSPFRYFDELKTAASTYNHKVISVELAGNEDVYNGTVDEYHNFFIGGWASGNKKFFINNLQCGEIELRSNQFCNLSELVINEEDDLDSLLDKTETAVWLGVIQSSFTKFPYLNKKWQENCDEERLLGVSITGQYDAPHLLTEEALKAMKNRAIKTAQKASKAMGINMPAAITCVKPSGTVSQLTNSASGMHPRYSEYYIRRYRIASTDPLMKMMRAQGFSFSPENGQSSKDWDAALIADMSGNSNPTSICPMYIRGEQWSEDKVTTWVVSFPVKAPEGCVKREAVSAIDQLEWYKKVQTNWSEHNSSLTVYVRADEWITVGNWVYNNWDIVNGVSFLPYEDTLHVYEQAPYEEISKEQYEAMIENFKDIDYSQLSMYEQEDNTALEKSYACSGDKCELK